MACSYVSLRMFFDLKKSLSAFAMNMDGTEFTEFETLKNWDDENQ